MRLLMSVQFLRAIWVRMQCPANLSSIAFYLMFSLPFQREPHQKLWLLASMASLLMIFIVLAIYIAADATTAAASASSCRCHHHCHGSIIASADKPVYHRAPRLWIFFLRTKCQLLPLYQPPGHSPCRDWPHDHDPKYSRFL